MQTNSLYSKVMMEHAVRSCAFNPDGTHLAVGMMDGSFSILVSKSVHYQIEIKWVHFQIEIKQIHCQIEIKWIHFQIDIKQIHFQIDINMFAFTFYVSVIHVYMCISKHLHGTSQKAVYVAN